MNQVLPDWMFASFAIGAWTLGSWITRRWEIVVARQAGEAIVMICIIVLGVRYVSRYIYRKRNPEIPDPNEWKQF